MKSDIQTADENGCVILPGFANATVIVEAISDSEYRVRAVCALSDEELFPEDRMPIELSERDAKLVIDLIENPPKPNAAMLRAAARYKKNFVD